MIRTLRHATLRAVFAVSILILLTVAPVVADEPFGVKLMRPDSLAGWEYGDPAPVGWTIVEGRLTGRPDATPLLSGFSFGDFELRFQWAVTGGGVWKIALPDVPAGKGLELILREGDACGRLQDGDKTLAPGGKIEPCGDKMHTAQIRRAGGKLALTVDDRQLYEIDLPPDRRFGLALAVAGGEATLADLRVEEPAGVPIFNGADLAGWWCPGNPDAWQAKDDELVLANRGGNYLRTENEYGNFTLSMEFIMRKRGNSGIGIRTPRDGWPSGDGMELQLEDRPGLGSSVTMAIYRNVAPIARADKSEEYNRVVVKADGWMISVWVNGELVQQTNTFQHPELKHRNLKGWIGFQDHGAWIRVRNLRLLEAPDGTGLDAWNRPLPPGAVVAVVDRLMNPESLATADGIRSATVATTVAGDDPAEHVLAELTGPGAIVRIARNNHEGQLAFYFDGEDEPRLESPSGNLHRVVPLADDSDPVLTFLPYEKSLKVVLRNRAGGEYRFDYLALPGDVAVETFTGPRSGLPRGWFDAINYYHSHFNWGVHREFDPPPRFNAEPRTIEPGASEPLIHVDGAGVVRWVKLRANKGVLGNNDLWLEATVDGESTPAVSAPARYWFPALAGAGNFHNFVMTDRGGVTNMLTMPFADGITLSAKNCGVQPIPGVGMTISVEQATERNRDLFAGRMRLRGIFQSAGEGTNEFVHQEGTGRWVALIYQQPDDDPTGIDSLLVDGKPADGWATPSLDPFLGQDGNDWRAALSGRRGAFCWRYLLLAPVDFSPAPAA